MKTEQIQKQISQEEIEARKLIEYLTTPVIDLKPEGRSKDYPSNFQSSGPKLIELGDLSPGAILEAVNQDLPESWKKQISEISFKK